MELSIYVSQKFCFSTGACVFHSLAWVLLYANTCEITIRKLLSKNLHELNTIHADGLNCHCAAPIIDSDLHLRGSL